MLLCGIILLAAWLRFDHLDQVEFLWDQAEISKWALRMAQEREITWIGPISSTGVDTFPVAIWLLAIPYAISTSPVFASGFIAALNLLTVIGCYFLARRWFGRTAALVATLLYAVAPWAVIYSRKIWHTVLLPPVAMLHVMTGWQAFVRGRRWALPAHFLVLAVLVQTHLTGLPFVLLTGLWALVFRKRLDWRVVPLGVLVAALAFAPYFVVDAQRGWRNAQRFLEVAQLPAEVDARAAYVTWAITVGGDLYRLTGPDHYPAFVAATPNARWLFPVEGVLAVAGFAIALWYAIRRARAGLDDETAAALMVATWLAMPVLFLTRHSTRVAPHYTTPTFPSQFILVGWLVGRAGRLKGHWAQAGRVLLVVLVVVLAAAQTYEIVSILRFVMTGDTRAMPIAYEIEAVETAKDLAQEAGAEEVIVFSVGDEPRMYEMPNVADVLMYGFPHRAVDGRTALVLPAEPAIYWTTCDGSPGEALLATFTPEVEDARVLLRGGVHSFRFYSWQGGEPAVSCMRPLPDGPRTWANGAQLLGYCLEGDLNPGGTIRWTLVWQPTETPTEDVYYHWFNHLLDGQGELRGQGDGPSLLPASWRAGDTVFNWFDIQVSQDAAPGAYAMRVGMYTYTFQDGATGNIPLVDAAGDSTAGVEIELQRAEE